MRDLQFPFTTFLTDILTHFLPIARKSQKWVQMQRNRCGEKRKGGHVDMGKHVHCLTWLRRVHGTDRL